MIARPEKGLLAYEMGIPTIVQYWRSFDHLEAFARDKDDPHLDAWRTDGPVVAGPRAPRGAGWLIIRGVMSAEGAFAYERANSVQKFLRRFAASGPGSWLFARVAHRLDRPVHRLTRGRHTLGSAITGLPVVMLTTTGARSGQPRTVPVLGIPVGGGVAIIASNFGQRRHPGWYYNLRARPEAQVVIDGVRQSVRAVEAEGERRAEIWQEGLRVYPGFAQYEQRASHRRISVFVLEPA